MRCAQLDTGILLAQCVCQMGRYAPPAGPEEQSLFMRLGIKRRVDMIAALFVTMKLGT